jgi:hypothetical protein
MRRTHDRRGKVLFCRWQPTVRLKRPDVVRPERPTRFERLEDRSLMTANPWDILIDALPTDSWTIINPLTLPSIIAPSGPSGIAAPGEAFDPSSAGITFNGTPTAAAPDIAEWTRTAGPDESISIAGDDFSGFQGGRTKFFVFADSGAGPGRIYETTTQSVQGDNRAVITLPRTGLASDAMYMIWAADDDGVSQPVFVNQTEAWWIGPDAAQAGQKIALFGRNLTQTAGQWTRGQSPGSAPSFVWIAPQAGGQAIQVQVTSANPYRVEFELPSNLAAGNYRAWVHNGKGGNFGWSAPLNFTVRSPQLNGTSWTGPTYDITNTPELAQILTNGNASDAVLLQTVFTRAGQTPFSTVVLPAGTFYIDQFINLPSRVRLVGQGMDQTFLQARATNGDFWMIISDGAGRQSTGALFENLTLHSGYNPLGANDPAYTGGVSNVIRIYGQTDMTFRNVRFDGRTDDAAHFEGVNRVRFEGCEFYGYTPLFFNSSKQVFIDDCQFFLTNQGGGGIGTWAGEQISITNSKVQSLDASEASRTANWGTRLFVNAKGGRYRYIGHNETQNLGLPGYVQDNVGEQILWEGGSSFFGGRATRSLGNTVTISNAPANLGYATGQFSITVIQGQGVGQSRKIIGASVSGSVVTLQLETAFRVELDSTSEIQILYLGEKSVVYDNDLHGVRENVERDAYIGTSGVMLYNGNTDIIIDSNQFTDVRRAISVYAYTDISNPSFNRHEIGTQNFVANNVIRNARYGIVVYSYGGVPGTTDLTRKEKSTLLGNVFRRNTVDGALISAFDVASQWRNGQLPVGEIVDNLIIEHNTFQNTPTGINMSLALSVDYRGVAINQAIVRDALLYKNTLLRSSSNPNLVDIGSKGIIVGMGQAVSLIGNTVSGYDLPVATDIPISVRKTGNPNQFTFTLSGRELDRKGGQFLYQADLNGDGAYDLLPGGLTTVVAGDVYTFTHTFTNPNVNPTFWIQTQGDNFRFAYKLQRWGDTFVPVDSSPIPVAILAGPTANAREYSFQMFVDNFMEPGRAVNMAFDWNGDGDFSDAGETKVGQTGANWTYTFPQAVVNNVYYRVWDQAGNATGGMISVNSARRDVVFEGSSREDWIRFRQGTNNAITAELSRVNGRAINFSQTFQSVTGMISAAMNAGPDLADGSAVTTVPMLLVGGSESDTLLGGGSNDQIFGGSHPSRFPTLDAANVVSGGGGTNTINAGGPQSSPFAESSASPALATQAVPASSRLEGFSFGGLLESSSTGSSTAWRAAIDLTFASLPTRSVTSPTWLSPTATPSRSSGSSTSVSSEEKNDQADESWAELDDEDLFDIIWGESGSAMSV